MPHCLLPQHNANPPANVVPSGTHLQLRRQPDVLDIGWCPFGRVPGHIAAPLPHLDKSIKHAAFLQASRNEPSRLSSDDHVATPHLLVSNCHADRHSNVFATLQPVCPARKSVTRESRRCQLVDAIVREPRQNCELVRTRVLAFSAIRFTRRWAGSMTNASMLTPSLTHWPGMSPLR